MTKKTVIEGNEAIYSQNLSRKLSANIYKISDFTNVRIFGVISAETFHNVDDSNEQNKERKKNFKVTFLNMNKMFSFSIRMPPLNTFQVLFSASNNVDDPKYIDIDQGYIYKDGNIEPPVYSSHTIEQYLTEELSPGTVIENFGYDTSEFKPHTIKFRKKYKKSSIVFKFTSTPSESAQFHLLGTSQLLIRNIRINNEIIPLQNCFTWYPTEDVLNPDSFPNCNFEYVTKSTDITSYYNSSVDTSGVFFRFYTATTFEFLFFRYSRNTDIHTGYLKCPEFEFPTSQDCTITFDMAIRQIEAYKNNQVEVIEMAYEDYATNPRCALRHDFYQFIKTNQYNFQVSNYQYVNMHVHPLINIRSFDKYTDLEKSQNEFVCNCEEYKPNLTYLNPDVFDSSQLAYTEIIDTKTFYGKNSDIFQSDEYTYSFDMADFPRKRSIRLDFISYGDVYIEELKEDLKLTRNETFETMVDKVRLERSIPDRFEEGIENKDDDGNTILSPFEPWLYMERDPDSEGYFVPLYVKRNRLGYDRVYGFQHGSPGILRISVNLPTNINTTPTCKFKLRFVNIPSPADSPAIPLSLDNNFLFTFENQNTNSNVQNTISTSSTYYDVQVSQPRKILALHGGGSNSSAFRNQIGMKNLIENQNLTDYKFEFEFIDADNGLWWADAPTDYYGGKGTTNDVNHAEASINKIKQFINDNGPFYGILGYSQGAAMVITFLAYTNIHFEKVLLFNGYLPTTHLGLMQTINAATLTEEPLIFLSSDDVFYDMGLEIKTRFTNYTEVISTKAGHDLPIENSDETFNSVVNYLLRDLTSLPEEHVVNPPKPSQAQHFYSPQEAQEKEEKRNLAPNPAFFPTHQHINNYSQPGQAPVSRSPQGIYEENTRLIAPTPAFVPLLSSTETKISCVVLFLDRTVQEGLNTIPIQPMQTTPSSSTSTDSSQKVVLFINENLEDYVGNSIRIDTNSSGYRIIQKTREGTIKMDYDNVVHDRYITVFLESKVETSTITRIEARQMEYAYIGNVSIFVRRPVKSMLQYSSDKYGTMQFYDFDTLVVPRSIFQNETFFVDTTFIQNNSQLLMRHLETSLDQNPEPETVIPTQQKTFRQISTMSGKVFPIATSESLRVDFQEFSVSDTFSGKQFNLAASNAGEAVSYDNRFINAGVASIYFLNALEQHNSPFEGGPAPDYKDDLQMRIHPRPPFTQTSVNIEESVVTTEDFKYNEYGPGDYESKDLYIYVDGGKYEYPFYQMYKDVEGTQEWPKRIDAADGKEKYVLDINHTYYFSRLNSALSHPFYVGNRGYNKISSSTMTVERVLPSPSESVPVSPFYSTASNNNLIEAIPLYESSLSVLKNNEFTNRDYNYQKGDAANRIAPTSTSVYREYVPGKTMLHLGYSHDTSYSFNSSHWADERVTDSYVNSNFNLYLIYAYYIGNEIRWNWIQGKYNDKGQFAYRRGNSSKTFNTGGGNFQIDVLNDIINDTSVEKVANPLFFRPNTGSTDSLGISNYESSSIMHIYAYNHDTVFHEIHFGREGQQRVYRGPYISDAVPASFPHIATSRVIDGNTFSDEHVFDLNYLQDNESFIFKSSPGNMHPNLKNSNTNYMFFAITGRIEVQVTNFAGYSSYYCVMKAGSEYEYRNGTPHERDGNLTRELHKCDVDGLRTSGVYSEACILDTYNKPGSDKWFEPAPSEQSPNREKYFQASTKYLQLFFWYANRLTFEIKIRKKLDEPLLPDFKVESSSFYTKEDARIKIDVKNIGNVASTGKFGMDWRRIFEVTTDPNGSEQVGILNEDNNLTPINIVDDNGDKFTYYAKNTGWKDVPILNFEVSSSNSKYNIGNPSYIDTTYNTLYLASSPLHDPDDIISYSFEMKVGPGWFEVGKTYIFCADDTPFSRTGNTVETIDDLDDPSNNFFVWTVEEPNESKVYSRDYFLVTRGDGLDTGAFKTLRIKSLNSNYESSVIISDADVNSQYKFSFADEKIAIFQQSGGGYWALKDNVGKIIQSIDENSSFNMDTYHEIQLGYDIPYEIQYDDNPYEKLLAVPQTYKVKLYNVSKSDKGWNGGALVILDYENLENNEPTWIRLIDPIVDGQRNVLFQTGFEYELEITLKYQKTKLVVFHGAEPQSQMLQLINSNNEVVFQGGPFVYSLPYSYEQTQFNIDVSTLAPLNPQPIVPFSDFELVSYTSTDTSHNFQFRSLNYANNVYQIEFLMTAFDGRPILETDARVTGLIQDILLDTETQIISFEVNNTSSINNEEFKSFSKIEFTFFNRVNNCPQYYYIFQKDAIQVDDGIVGHEVLKMSFRKWNFYIADETLEYFCTAHPEMKAEFLLESKVTRTQQRRTVQRNVKELLNYDARILIPLVYFKGVSITVQFEDGPISEDNIPIPLNGPQGLIRTTPMQLEKRIKTRPFFQIGEFQPVSYREIFCETEQVFPYGFIVVIIPSGLNYDDMSIHQKYRNMLEFSLQDGRSSSVNKYTSNHKLPHNIYIELLFNYLSNSSIFIDNQKFRIEANTTITEWFKFIEMESHGKIPAKVSFDKDWFDNEIFVSLSSILDNNNDIDIEMNTIFDDTLNQEDLLDDPKLTNDAKGRIINISQLENLFVDSKQVDNIDNNIRNVEGFYTMNLDATELRCLGRLKAQDGIKITTFFNELLMKVPHQIILYLRQEKVLNGEKSTIIHKIQSHIDVRMYILYICTLKDVDFNKAYSYESPQQFLLSDSETTLRSGDAIFIQNSSEIDKIEILINKNQASQLYYSQDENDMINFDCLLKTNVTSIEGTLDDTIKNEFLEKTNGLIDIEANKKNKLELFKLSVSENAVLKSTLKLAEKLQEYNYVMMTLTFLETSQMFYALLINVPDRDNPYSSDMDIYLAMNNYDEVPTTMNTNNDTKFVAFNILESLKKRNTRREIPQILAEEPDFSPISSIISQTTPAVSVPIPAPIPENLSPLQKLLLENRGQRLERRIQFKNSLRRYYIYIPTSFDLVNKSFNYPILFNFHGRVAEEDVDADTYESPAASHNEVSSMKNFYNRPLSSNSVPYPAATPAIPYNNAQHPFILIYPESSVVFNGVKSWDYIIPQAPQPLPTPINSSISSSPYSFTPTDVLYTPSTYPPSATLHSPTPSTVGFSFSDYSTVTVDNDFAFVRFIVNEVTTLLNMGTDELYATGFEDGGTFCYALAASPTRVIPFSFKAIAVVSGLEAVNQRFEGSSKTSILHVHGTYDINRNVTGTNRLGMRQFFESVESTIGFWSSKLGSDYLVSNNEFQMTNVLSDRNYIRRNIYKTSNLNGQFVEYYSIDTGGSEWFGAKKLDINGMELDEIIWETFRNGPLPPIETRVDDSINNPAPAEKAIPEPVIYFPINYAPITEQIESINHAHTLTLISQVVSVDVLNEDVNYGYNVDFSHLYALLDKEKSSLLFETARNLSRQNNYLQFKVCRIIKNDEWINNENGMNNTVRQAIQARFLSKDISNEYNKIHDNEGGDALKGQAYIMKTMYEKDNVEYTNSFVTTINVEFTNKSFIDGNWILSKDEMFKLDRLHDTDWYDYDLNTVVVEKYRRYVNYFNVKSAEQSEGFVEDNEIIEYESNSILYDLQKELKAFNDTRRKQYIVHLELNLSEQIPYIVVSNFKRRRINLDALNEGIFYYEYTFNSFEDNYYDILGLKNPDNRRDSYKNFSKIVQNHLNFIKQWRDVEDGFKFKLRMSRFFHANSNRSTLLANRSDVSVMDYQTIKDKIDISTEISVEKQKSIMVLNGQTQTFNEIKFQIPSSNMIPKQFFDRFTALDEKEIGYTYYKSISDSTYSEFLLFELL